jgi:hypothetical protein
MEEEEDGTERRSCYSPAQPDSQISFSISSLARRRIMKALMGGGVIGTALGGGIALGVMLVRRRGVSGGVLSQIAPPTSQREDLEGLAKAELYERARRANIAGRSRMSKDRLIRALRATTYGLPR